MLTRRRIITTVVLVVVLALAWSVWLAVQTARDLRAAQASVDRIEAAITARDSGARSAAITDLQASAASAKNRTDGFWWGAITLTPFVGDDASGIRELSKSLDLVASQAIAPLGDTVDDLDSLTAGGRVDVAKVAALQDKVSTAHDAFSTAAELVRAEDSSGFAGAFRSRYDDYVDTVSELARDLGAAETAVEILPGMLGAEKPRQYLLIFENNAEIRATGGLPGSWALVKADDGKLDMSEQGSARDFDVYANPIGDLTSAEKALFGPEMGRFFQDPNFTPDFPRAAEVFNAFWAERYPEQPLDGVVSIDVVALSYLLDGLGPVQADDLTLSADNVVEQLLSTVYKQPDPAKQDEMFRGVARSIFEKVTLSPEDPIALVEGIGRAAREGRFHVASFDKGESELLAGTRVAGELSSDDGATPHIDVALNDGTASKMSYYLRYDTEIRSMSCDEGIQQLEVSIALTQTVSPRDAAALPSDVTGRGPVGTRPGNQLVRVHVFAPFGGNISNVKIDGKAVSQPEAVNLRGRSAVTLAALIDSLDDVIITLSVESGAGQIADGVLQQTPSVVPGGANGRFRSSC